MALNVTPGDASADSYATLAEFTAYAAARVPALAWVATATDGQKEAALKQAARSLDDAFIWTGGATDADVQALCWPRTSMLNRNGGAIADTIIPAALKNAQCELALQVGAANLLADNDAAKQGIASVKAGSVAVTFQNKDTSSSEGADVDIRRQNSEFNYLSVPGEVRRLLVPSWYEQPSFKRPFLFEAM